MINTFKRAWLVFVNISSGAQYLILTNTRRRLCSGLASFINSFPNFLVAGIIVFFTIDTYNGHFVFLS